VSPPQGFGPEGIAKLVATKAGNKFGLEAWDLVNATDAIACFKRPKM
jgi:hypothetical protein